MNNELYDAYNRQTGGGIIDPHERYWYMMSDNARSYYKAKHKREPSPFVARTIEQLLTRLLAEQIEKALDKLFGGIK